MPIEPKFNKGDHYGCTGCSCTCHERPGRAADDPTGFGPSQGPCGATWHPSEDAA